MPMLLRDGSIYAPVESQHMILRDGKSVDAIHASLYNNLSSSQFFWPDSRRRASRNGHFYEENGIRRSYSDIIPQSPQQSRSTIGFVLDAISQITQRFAFSRGTAPQNNRRYSSPEKYAARPPQSKRRFSSPQNLSPARSQQVPPTEQLNSVIESPMSSVETNDPSLNNLTSTPKVSKHTIYLPSAARPEITNASKMFSVASVLTAEESGYSMPSQNKIYQPTTDDRAVISEENRYLRVSADSIHSPAISSQISAVEAIAAPQPSKYSFDTSESINYASSRQMFEGSRYSMAITESLSAVNPSPKTSFAKKISLFMKKSSAVFMPFAKSSKSSPQNHEEFMEEESAHFQNKFKGADEFLSDDETKRRGKSYLFIIALFALIASKYFIGLTNYLAAAENNIKRIVVSLRKLWKKIFNVLIRIPVIFFRENPLFKRYSFYPVRKTSSTDIRLVNSFNVLQHFLKGIGLFSRYLPIMLSLILLWRVYFQPANSNIMDLDIPNSNKLDLRFGNNMAVWHISPPKARTYSASHTMKIFGDDHPVIIHLRDHTMVDMIHRVNVLKILSDSGFHVIVPVRPISTIEFVNLWSAIIKSMNKDQSIYVWSDITNAEKTIAYVQHLTEADIFPDGVVMETKVRDSVVRNLEIWKGGTGKVGRAWNYLKCPLFVPTDCKQALRQEMGLCIRAISFNADFKARSYDV